MKILLPLEPFIIIFFNIIIYSRTIKFDLVMDDYQWWFQRRTKGFCKITKNLKGFIDNRFYSGTTFGTNTKIEHAFTIFLHTLICILIYLSLGHNQVSFFASILYSCNPINNQTSIWLNGRRYAVNIILVLLMMLFPLVSPLLYLATGLFQVTAFFAPILIFRHSFWYLALIPLLLACSIGYIRAKYDNRTSTMPKGDLLVFKPSRAIIIVKTYGFFFFKMIFPQVCAMQYPDRLKWGQTKEGSDNAYSLDFDFFKGCLSIIISLGMVLFIPSNLRPLAVFMGLAILQWSAILPITQILSDRYCSLPNVFVMFFISYFASFTGIFYIPIIALLCMYYYVCLSVVLPMYKNLESFYEYHFTHFPHLSWYRHNLIQDMMNEGNKETAFIHVYEGLRYDPKDFRLLMWGVIMAINQGNLVSAESFLTTAENNLYLHREVDQLKEINYMRTQIQKMKPILKKQERMTTREREILKNRIRLK